MICNIMSENLINNKIPHAASCLTINNDFSFAVDHIGQPQYTEVLSLTHHNPDRDIVVLQIYTNHTVLRITDNHWIVRTDSSMAKRDLM